MRLIGLFGGPATGKSTVMKRFIETLRPGISLKHGKTLYYTMHGDLAVLGIYDKTHEFPGTDRLSMAVLGDACHFVQKATGLKIRTVVFEGDRLSNARFLKYAEKAGFDLRLIELCPNPETLMNRRSHRRQDPGWVSGRDTKMANLKIRFPMLSIKHDDGADTQRVLDKMVEWSKY